MGLMIRGMHVWSLSAAAVGTMVRPQQGAGFSRNPPHLDHALNVGEDGGRGTSVSPLGQIPAAGCTSDGAANGRWSGGSSGCDDGDPRASTNKAGAVRNCGRAAAMGAPQPTLNPQYFGGKIISWIYEAC